jgi:hypothetical protein
MSVVLKLTHEEGLRLRQQQAQDVARTEDNVVVTPDGNKHTIRGGLIQGGSKEWKFVRFENSDHHVVEDVPQDEDMRRVDANGKKIKLGTYTVSVVAGMKNLVIERLGKVIAFNFKNPAIRNQLRVRYQTLEKTGKKTKEGKEIHEWRDSGQPQYIPPNTFGGAFVGTGQRAIVDEMPT